MNWHFQSCSTWGYLLTLSLPGIAEAPINHDQKSAPRIVVRVYNFARIPQPELLKAQEESARILKEAGIEAAWLDCPISPDSSGSPACQPSSGLTEFVLEVLPLSKVKRAKDLSLRNDSLGLAYHCREGQPACTAKLYYDRVERLSRRTLLSNDSSWPTPWLTS